MKQYRRAILWSLLGAVTTIVVLLVVQVRTVRHERALAEELRRYMDMQVPDREKVAMARAEGKVGVDDLPTVLRWFKLLGGPRWRQYVGNRLYQWASPDSTKPAVIELSNLGLFGFKVLGTIAGAAIPELVRLYRAEYFPHAFPIEVFAAIGEPAWLVADQFATSSDVEERLFAAKLIGVLHARPKESVDLLLKLIHDRSSRVREMALKALGEFPSAEGEEVFIPMLQNPDDEDQFMIGAYGLRNGSTNALLALVRAYGGTTNNRAKAAVFVAFMDRGSKRQQALEDRTYFHAMPAMNLHNYYRFPMFTTDLDEERAWSGMRSNILVGRDPDFHGVFRRVIREEYSLEATDSTPFENSRLK
jgi:hypothetical protein